MTGRSDILFEEEQRPRQPLLWLLLLGMTLLFGYGFVQQIVFRRPWGMNPAPDWGMALIAACVIAFDALFYSLRLITLVRSDGLYIRFFPLHPSFVKIPLEDMVRCEAVAYRPLREYFGWGIRYGRGGKAYNVSGNRGVRLVYASGRHLLIGSQRPEELAEALEQLLN
jgi:hypothetical protein